MIFGLITGAPRNSDLPKKAVEAFVHFGKHVTNKSKMARADIAAIADIHPLEKADPYWKPSFWGVYVSFLWSIGVEFTPNTCLEVELVGHMIGKHGH